LPESVNSKQATFVQGLEIEMGLNFYTKAGIFNFTPTVGSAFYRSPSFGDTFVHFGHLNIF